MAIWGECRQCGWRPPVLNTHAQAEDHALRYGHDVEIVERTTISGTTCSLCAKKIIDTQLACLGCGATLCDDCWAKTDGRCCE